MTLLARAQALYARLSTEARGALVDAVTAAAAILGVLAVVTAISPDLNLPAADTATITTVAALLTAFTTWARKHGITPKATLPKTARGRVLGRLPAVFPARLGFLHSYMTSIPAPPTSVPVPAVTGWGVDGNDQYGDCTMAEKPHALLVWNHLMRTTDPVPTAAEVVDQYKALTGCKTPGDSHDTGLVISSLLDIWKTEGLFGGSTIAAYAPVLHTDITAIKECIDAYGVCELGVNLPQSAEDQFAAGQPWTFVGDQPIGGHDVVAVAYDADWVDIVTWGAVVKVSYEWLAHYLEEAWAVISHEFVEAGRGPTLNLAALEADLASLDTPIPAPKPKAVHRSWWVVLFGRA